MKNVNRLVATIALTCMLGVSAIAGETQTPPCVPGQVDTPPCAGAPSQTSTPPDGGETHSPPAANALDILSVAEAAMNLLLIF